VTGHEHEVQKKYTSGRVALRMTDCRVELKLKVVKKAKV
jgi:hypothetical protein